MKLNFSIVRKLAGKEVLRLIAKISLGLSFLAIIFLLFIAYYFGSDEKSYSEIIYVLWQTRDNLLLSVFIVGSFMITFIAMITWVLCLYSSFRLVGPLHRLQTQLGLVTKDEDIHLTRLRHKDSLLLKMSYRSARESIKKNKEEEKSINDKIITVIKYMECKQFANAEIILKELKYNLSKIKI